MAKPLALHSDRLFPSDPATRAIARALHAEVAGLPIVSPHGHTDPRWFADDEPFPDPATLLITPDHYLFRMLHSQGMALEALGIGPEGERDSRTVWRTFARHYHLFRATPSRSWFDWVLAETFGIDVRLMQTLPTRSTTASRRRWRPMPFARAHSTTATASRSSPRPNRRSTTWRIIAVSPGPAGADVSSRPIGPTRWWTRTMKGLPPTLSGSAS